MDGASSEGLLGKTGAADAGRLNPHGPMSASDYHRRTLPRVAVAFNVFNAETILGVSAAVQEAGGTAFLQTSASTVRCYGAVALAGMINALVPSGVRDRIVLHLDHCDA